ncbi:phosphoribosylformylglycinamidine cyclo-ligase [Marinitoga sp. 1135]|uniref:Phosphoribosylformylglycinamidine cyclo-ligase n=1 Tax=Marinitoga piezophila (strain DSM 14283 / JCM 11233 / KA3) TaxID=443254 RepID=H2J4H3_MARPK|nr:MULTISPECIES: phosphoribosylformylglycinamidine cyclo-ligase [Marinitoga]AEX84828.1 phosphoribosylaminoimidazole synthetase [Marinitoga piezophila KA3]APT75337.1 phosphoribosylformylglycinamidine cyclo-ligase [Marinitoga sp. 1137]NUU95067.1 phosphoribosylformylglycinamidine cyclo-ligase [Marinitoga sp. 1135]NUU97021.1 phosphoribosylformylglycinamidine cyclo-ligase [Marinitoga sp. 1138]
MDYKSSGVNIDEANSMISKVKDKLKENAGLYAGLFPLKNIINEYENPVLVSSTDGVGTKMILLEERNRWDIVANDLVGMVLNDLVCMGAKPLFFLDYYATGKLDGEKGAAFLNELIKVLEKVNCELLGGETAELPGMLVKDRVDVAGFAVGIVDKDKIPGKEKVKEGDIVIGLPSSGFHSNGYSLVRKLLDENRMKFDEKIIAPTKLYVNETLKIKDYIHAAAHITGGGIGENLSRVIPEGYLANIHINWKIPEVFERALNAGVKIEEAFRVFNMGIGMIYILPQENLQKVKEILEEMDISIYEIGKIIKTDEDEKVRINL